MKKFEKNLKKTLNNLPFICYNNTVVKKGILKIKSIIAKRKEDVKK